MDNIIYDYPKSACKCYGCDSETYSNVKDVSTELQEPSNLSISDCDISSVYDCYNTQKPFHKNIEPNDKKGYTILNENVLSNKIKYPGKQGFPKTHISSDPRLISPLHSGQVLRLDRPPVESKIQLKNISGNKSLNNYGQNYNTYNDINAGNIMYYHNKEIEDPFHNPNFTNPAYIEGFVYKDPMGSLKPIYNRKPIKNSEHLNTNNNNYTGNLSWIQDSTEHRENLISSQMAKRHQEKWESRWQ